MFLARFLFKLVNVMNSETSPRSLAAAFGLGIFIGLVPLATLQAALCIAIVLFLRVNISLALGATIFARLVSGGFADSFHQLGMELLEREDLYDFWSTVTNHAVLSYASLNNSVALGRTVVALVLLVPAWLTGFLLVRFYRNRVEDWLMQSRLVTFLKSLRIYSLYRTVTSPFG